MANTSKKRLPRRHDWIAWLLALGTLVGLNLLFSGCFKSTMTQEGDFGEQYSDIPKTTTAGSSATLNVSSPSATLVNGSGTATYTLTYGNASSISLKDSDITLTTTDGANCAATVSVTGPTTRTVILSSCSGNGTVGISIAAGSATDIAGNPAPAAASSTQVTVDTGVPTLSITAPSVAEINSQGTSYFSVTYTGATHFTFSASDVSLNTIGTATCGNTNVTPQSASVYRVTLSSCTGNGAIGISIAANTAQDAAGNQAAPSSPSSIFTVDNMPPTLTVGAPSSTLINGLGTASYTLTYGDASGISLKNADITLTATGGANCAATVSGTGPTTRTVTLSSCSGNGTVGISIAAGSATDTAGNPTPATASSTPVTVDTSVPTLSISAPSASLINSNGTSYFDVTYTGISSSQLKPSHITLNTTGDVSCAKNVNPQSTNVYRVTLSSCTGNGTVGISLAANTAQDAAGNQALAAGPSSTLEVDNAAPALSVSSPSMPLVNGSGTASYTLTYSGASSINLKNSDITLNTTNGANCTATVGGAGTTTRTVTLSSCSGNGTAGISIAAGSATDAAGNPALEAASSTQVTVDTNAPTLSIGAPSAAEVNSNRTSYFDVTYTGANTIIPPANASITLTKTGTANCTGVQVVHQSTDVIRVTLSNCTGDGTVRINIPANSATDSAGNQALATGPSDALTVDNSGPVITIGAASASPINSNGSSYFDITYSGAKTISLSPGNITVANPLGAVTCSGKDLTSPSDYVRRVTLSGCTGDGTVGISIAPDTALDPAGNQASGAASPGTFTVANAGLAITISAASTPSINSGGSSYFDILYLGANTITLSDGDITVNNPSGAVSCSNKVLTNPLGNVYRVTFSGCTGDGTIGISILANTAQDAFSNPASAAGPSGTFTVYNSPPTISISAPSVAEINSTGESYFEATYTGASTITLTDVTLVPTGTAACDSKVISAPSTNVRRITLSSCTGNGTIGISIAANTAHDAAGNQAAAVSSGTALTVDNSAPTLAVSSPSLTLVNGLGTATYTLNYGDASSIGLKNADITLTTTGGANCAAAVSGTGPTTRTVTLSSCSGNGTVGISIAAGSSTDTAKNPAPAAASSTQVTVDTNAPTLSISAPSAAEINSTGESYFDLTYTGATHFTFSASDVSLNTIGTAMCGNTNVTPQSASVYRVTLSSCTGNGTVGISIAANTAQDAAGNQAAPSSPSSIFTVDNMPPTLTVSAPSPDLVNGTGTASYTLTYGDTSSISLKDADITLTPSGGANCAAAVSGTGPTTRTVTLSSCSGNGTVGISIAAGSATDIAGNSTPVTASSTQVTVTTDAPTLSISAPFASLINSNGTSYFDVTYAGISSSGLNLSHITLNATGGVSCAKNVNQQSANVYRVTLSSCTGNGTVGISIAANTAQNAAGSQAPAAGPSSTLEVDNTAPALPSVSLASFSNTNSTAVRLTTASCVDIAKVYVNEGTQPLATAAGWQDCVTTNGGLSYVLPSPALQGIHTIKSWFKDAAGNVSTSSSNLTLTYDSVPPGDPEFSLITPTSPNISVTPSVIGSSTYTSADTSTLLFYDNSTCSGGPIGSGSRAAFVGSGIQVSVVTGVTTSIYARAFDAAGNASGCASMTTYLGLGPTQTIALIATSLNDNGNNPGATLSMSKPSNTASGQLMLAVVTARLGSITPPVDWTELRTDSTGISSAADIIQAVYYKVAGSSEPSSYDFSFGISALNATGILLTYAGVNTANPIVGHSGQVTTTASNPITAPSVTVPSTEPNSKLIAFFGAANSSAITPSPTPIPTLTPLGNAHPTGATDGTKTSTAAADLTLSSVGGNTGNRLAKAATAAKNIGQQVVLRPGELIPSYATKFDLSGPVNLSTGVCSSAFTLTAKNASDETQGVASDTTVTLGGMGAGTFYKDSGCTVPKPDSFVMTSGTLAATFYYMSYTPQSLSLSGSASGFRTGFWNIKVSETPTTPLLTLYAATTSAPKAGSCMEYVASINPVDTADQTVTVSAGGFGKIYTDNSCGTVTSSVTIPGGGTGSTSFYLKDPVAERTLVVATSPGRTLATLAIDIQSGAPAKVVMTGPNPIQAAGCQSYTATAQDSSGNVATMTASTSLLLADSRYGLFFSSSDTGCATPITSVSFPAGASSVSFRFSDNYAEDTTLFATPTNPAILQGSLQLTVNQSTTQNRLAIYKYNVTPEVEISSDLIQPYTPNCIAYTIKHLDPTGTPISVGNSSLTVTLKINATYATLYSSYSAPDCTGQSVTGTGTVTATIPAHGSSTTFGFKGTYGPGNAEVFTISAEATGVGSKSIGLIYRNSDTSFTRAKALVFSTQDPANSTDPPTIASLLSVPANTCYALSVYLLAADLSKTALATEDTVIQLRGNGSGRFYSDNQCTSASEINGSNLTIPRDQKRTSVFYFKDPERESLTLTAHGQWTTSDGIMSPTAYLSFHSTAAAASALALSGRDTISRRACHTFTASTVDPSGNLTPVATGKTVNVSAMVLPSGASSSSGRFYSDSNCSIILPNLTFSTADSSMPFYFKDDAEETVVLTVTDTAPSGALTSGQLSVDVTSPVAIDLDVGDNHVCAVVQGRVQCWGSGSEGKLGDGTTLDRASPSWISAADLSGVAGISLGTDHSCAWLNDGSLKCWGYNYYHQLGDGTTTSRSTPVPITGFAAPVISVSGGGGHTCAALSNGAGECWGSNDSAQLGSEPSGGAYFPSLILSAGSGVSSFSTSGNGTCVVFNSGVNGTAKCWGNNSYGQLGDGTTTMKTSIPVTAISGLSEGVVAIVSGERHTCALLSDGTVKCWGQNMWGQVGDNTGSGASTDMRLTPTFVVSPSGTGRLSGVTALAAGEAHTCALVRGGTWCWGSTTNGVLGYDPNNVGNYLRLPTQVPGLGFDAGVVSLSASVSGSFAKLRDGTLRCWGTTSDSNVSFTPYLLLSP